MSEKILAIKVDVDTDRGTRIGVPNLLKLFSELHIPATFLFSLGPDHTGRAIKRIFRPGFLKKINRSSVVSVYGFRTLLNGTLLPGPHIGKRNKDTIFSAYQAGHEVGIHCYDHIRWQDDLMNMTQDETRAEFSKAYDMFKTIFGFEAKTAGAAGWQANHHSLTAYDEKHLLYASDVRGRGVFFPRVGNNVFKTLQISTTLPTLDELLGRPEYPIHQLHDFYLTQLVDTAPNILTIHAELEGMKYLDWFKTFLIKAKAEAINFVTVETIAKKALLNPDQIPICDLIQGSIDGRSGTLALQGE